MKLCIMGTKYFFKKSRCKSNTTSIAPLFMKFETYRQIYIDIFSARFGRNQSNVSGVMRGELVKMALFELCVKLRLLEMCIGHKTRAICVAPLQLCSKLFSIP
jgi:hypothetical protein